MIKRPGALYAAAGSGLSAFLSSWEQWGLAAAFEALGGSLVFIAVLVPILRRFPVLDEPETAVAVGAWLKLVPGAAIALFGLICIGAGGSYIAAGIVLLVVGLALFVRGRRELRDRRWRRAHRGLFM